MSKRSKQVAPTRKSSAERISTKGNAQGGIWRVSPATPDHCRAIAWRSGALVVRRISQLAGDTRTVRLEHGWRKTVEQTGQGTRLSAAACQNHLKNKARWRKRLGEYVRRAYLGDRRGLLYWRRVGKVIWVAYENLLRLKVWAARTRDHEIERIERWEARADKERERVRAHRARKKAGGKKRGPKRQGKSRSRTNSEN